MNTELERSIMLNLYELEQLIAFSDMGTLSKAAEKLHISQPTITRAMQHLEEIFGVTLFLREKNRITLNETGIKAVEQAKQVLLTVDAALKNIKEYDKSLHTITINSCAPAPLWYVLPALTSAYPSMTIASSLKEISAILENLIGGFCQIAILPIAIQPEGYISIPFLEENLSVCVPISHELANKTSVNFSDLNGFNFLLKSEIGFWDEMCRVQMPSSKFLIQTDEFEYEELIKESSLPCFTTNLVSDCKNLFVDRVVIPVVNPEANVTYCLVCHSHNKTYSNIVKSIQIK